MTLQQAMDFISYNVKEGVYDETVLDGMSDGEIIEFAEREEVRAQMAYDNAKDEGRV